MGMGGVIVVVVGGGGGVDLGLEGFLLEEQEAIVGGGYLEV